MHVIRLCAVAEVNVVRPLAEVAAGSDAYADHGVIIYLPVRAAYADRIEAGSGNIIIVGLEILEADGTEEAV